MHSLTTIIADYKRLIAAAQPDPQGGVKDEPCRHSNSAFVREMADSDAERWVCHDCGVMFTREVPQ